MTNKISVTGIITCVLYFLSVGSFLITKSEAALTVWELMTVFSAPVVLFVLLELGDFLSITSICKKAAAVFMACACALTGVAHICKCNGYEKAYKRGR